MSVPTARQAKQNAAKREALKVALVGRVAASSASLATSYGLPVNEVQSAMRSMGVQDA